ncbi:MAG: LCP family protein [Streptosporangiaceae bacterium]
MSRYDDPGAFGWRDAGRSRRRRRPPATLRSSPRTVRGPGRRWLRGHSTSTLILGSVATLVALVMTAGSLTAYIEYRNVWDGINRISVAGDLTGKRPPADPHALNILVIGSDSRSGVNGQIGGHVGITGQRSDTDMVVHIAPGAHQVVVLSIPRDSVVPVLRCTAEPGTLGQAAEPAGYIEQINASFSNGGPGCLWKTIEQTTGIHINDFVELTFNGFEHVIDALGGVEVCLPEAVDDPTSRLHLSAGKHHVYGREALAFWRTREGLGMGDDPQRIQRDQFLMASLLQGIVHGGLLRSPTKVFSVIRAVTAHHYLTTDNQLTPSRMLQLAEDLRGISTEQVQFVTAPWTTYTGDAQWIHSVQPPSQGNPNWVQWLQPAANKLFTAIARDNKLPKAAKKQTGKNLKIDTVSPADVKVQVLNGTTTAGLAATTATRLTGRGFKVVGQPQDAALQTYTRTVIEYSAAAQLPAADTLAKLFKIVTVRQDAGLNSGAITLILGSSFTALKPARGSGSGGSSIKNLAGTYGGITGSRNICKDSNAFSGPG